MDRSFLSVPQVVAASTHFVCVRLLSYEDAGEMKFLKNVFAGRSGEAENTVFTIRSPDDKRTLVRARRSTRDGFRDAADLAATMERVAKEFEAKDRGTAALPVVANVRLGVNVAACDNQPLVVILGVEKARRAIEAKVAALAWAKEWRGRFVYARADSAKELAMLEGAEIREGVLVVAPEKFGRKGKVLAQAKADATAEGLAKVFAAALAKWQPVEKTFGSHVREGHRLGVFWETQTPVTNPMEARARERGKRDTGR
jgi:hypothetical protein